jgi:amino acid adenylation domain-containing protein
MAVAQAERHVSFDPDPAKGLLIARFENLANVVPDRAAVITDTSTTTLAELNGQANAVTQRLLEIGFPPDSLIVLFMAHGPDKIAAAIGVWKSGAAYVSVDTLHKDRGVEDMFSHTRSPIVLTDRENEARARRLAAPDVVVVEMSLVLVNLIERNADQIITSSTLASVVYTSGSTGTPKGVMRTHGHYYNDVARISAVTKYGRGDRVAHLQYLWMMQVFDALIAGATIHPFDLRREGLATMKAWLLRHRITCFESILTGFRQLLAGSSPDDLFPDMRIVMVTGEPLQREDVERFDRVFPRDCSLLNLFSSTEQNVIACFNIDRSAIPPNGGVVPIGFPAEGLDVQLLDERSKPVPRGAVGEITVRGPTLASGYWDDPDLSRRVLPPDPTTPGWRIYRTGDLAIMDESGCLHSRGRVDQQIKIRGHRVLPDEVENMLIEHSAIKAAVVVLDQVNLSVDRLVGYIVGETDCVPTTSELRAYLGGRLPDHMVPSVFMPVSSFELTATGKIDRRRLPPPKIDIERRTGDIVAPANHVEVVLKEIWEELLDEQEISVEDDFFLIGGDSVLAMTMFLKLERRLERQLPFEGLWLQGSTIRALAQTVSDGVPAVSWGRALPLQTNGDKPALFVVSQREMPIFCLSLIPYFGSDQPVYGLPARGIGGDTLPDRRIEDMAAHCIEMMRQVQPAGPYRIMGHSAAGLVAFEIARILGKQGSDVSKLVLLDSDMPGSAGRLAGKVLHQPVKAVRFAGSLFGQALGLSAPAGSVTRQAAKSSAYFRYRPKPYSGGAILVVASERQNTAELARRWRRLIKGDLVVSEVPGDHISMLQEPGIGELARTLMRQLED